MKGIKIDHEGIKKLYNAYLADKTPQSRKDCPSPELIFSLFQPSASDSKIDEILAHVLNCSHCSKDFQLILSSLREEKVFIDNIQEVLKSAEKANNKEKGFKSFFHRLSWKYAFFLLGMAIIAMVLVLEIPNTHVYRGTNHESIRLISPLDQHYSKSNLVFEWGMVENVDYFVLEIFNESLYPIWQSEKTTLNKMHLPSDAQAKLDSDEVYYWIVTAFMPNDRILESQLQKFVISK